MISPESKKKAEQLVKQVNKIMEDLPEEFAFAGFIYGDGAIKQFGLGCEACAMENIIFYFMTNSKDIKHNGDENESLNKN